jgi:hypothetical protein
VEVVDVVCVVGEKCVDARARANKQTKYIYSGTEQKQEQEQNKTSQSQEAIECASTQKILLFKTIIGIGT